MWVVGLAEVAEEASPEPFVDEIGATKTVVGRLDIPILVIEEVVVIVVVTKFVVDCTSLEVTGDTKVVFIVEIAEDTTVEVLNGIEVIAVVTEATTELGLEEVVTPEAEVIGLEVTTGTDEVLGINKLNVIRLEKVDTALVVTTEV